MRENRGAILITDVSERRFDRGAVFLLAAMIGFVLFALATSLAVLSLPGDGWQLDAGNPTTESLRYFAGAWATPLRAGDEVLGVEGQPVLQENYWQSVPRPVIQAVWREGQSVRYTIRRDGQVLDVAVRMELLDGNGTARALWHTISADPFDWLVLLHMLLLFLFRPRNSAARLLLVIGISLNAVTKIGWAGETISYFLAPCWLFYTRTLLTSFWNYLLIPSLLLLVISFPKRLFPLSRYPRAVPLVLFGAPFLVAVGMLVSLDAVAYLLSLFVEIMLVIAALIVATANAFKPSQPAVVRAQTVWLLLGLGLSIGLRQGVYLLGVAGVQGTVLTPGEWSNLAINALSAMALPLCMAIAVLRFHLFDVYIIIRRTLIYGLLTALLAGIYFGGVVVLQQVFIAMTGQRSELAIILSTLAIAALFVPLRNGIQSVIDRRFFHRKYNAAKMQESFAVTARDEVDSTKLVVRLVDVVDEALLPEHISLWLSDAVGHNTAVSGTAVASHTAEVKV